MRKLKVKLAYKVRYSEGEKEVLLQKVTQNYVLAAVNSKYDKGVDGSYRRILARILNKLDIAIDKDLEEIEVEESELDLIKNALRDAKLLAAMSYNAVLLEDAVEEAYKSDK